MDLAEELGVLVSLENSLLLELIDLRLFTDGLEHGFCVRDFEFEPPKHCFERGDDFSRVFFDLLANRRIEYPPILLGHMAA